MQEFLFPLLFPYLTLKDIEQMACACKYYHETIVTNALYKKRAVRFLQLALRTFDYHLNKYKEQKLYIQQKMDDIRMDYPRKIFFHY
jgi:hypothetical protein